MATMFNRFRKKERPATESSPAAQTSEPPDIEKSGVTAKAPEQHDGGSDDAPPLNLDGIDEEDLPPDIADLPRVVRNTVSLEDDPAAPCVTFRYFLLCFIFIPPGAILYQMGEYRTASAAYPILFVQIGRCSSFSPRPMS
jgi:hypothetical protein